MPPRIGSRLRSRDSGMGPRLSKKETTMRTWSAALALTVLSVLATEASAKTIPVGSLPPEIKAALGKYFKTAKPILAWDEALPTGLHIEVRMLYPSKKTVDVVFRKTKFWKGWSMVEVEVPM